SMRRVHRAREVREAGGDGSESSAPEGERSSWADGMGGRETPLGQVQALDMEAVQELVHGVEPAIDGVSSGAGAVEELAWDGVRQVGGAGRNAEQRAGRRAGVKQQDQAGHTR